MDNQIRLTDNLTINLKNYRNLMLVDGNGNNTDMITSIIDAHIRCGDNPMLVTDPDGQLSQLCFGRHLRGEIEKAERNYIIVDTANEIVNFLPWCLNADDSLNPNVINAIAASLAHPLEAVMNQIQLKAAVSYLSFIIAYTCSLQAMRRSLHTLHDVSRLGIQITSKNDARTRLDWLYKITCMDHPDSFLTRSFNIYNAAQLETRQYVARIVETMLASFSRRKEVDIDLNYFFDAKQVILLKTNMKNHQVGQNTTLLNAMLAICPRVNTRVEIIADISCMEMPRTMLDSSEKHVDNINLIITSPSISAVRYVCPPGATNIVALMNGIFFAKASADDLKQMQICTQYTSLTDADRHATVVDKIVRKRNTVPYQMPTETRAALFCGNIDTISQVSDTQQIHAA